MPGRVGFVVQSSSRVQLFATPQTVAHQAPLSSGFPRLEYWSGLPFPTPGIFLTQGSNPHVLCLLSLAGGFFITAPPGVQFSSVAESCPTFCNPMDCSRSGFPVHHQLPELAQTHVHWVSDAIQPSHPLSFSSPPTFNLSQHQGLFKWVSSSHQMAKVLEFQHQHQSFQWILRTDFL